ncbi:hypothetical protein [Paractinoplanes lichenicola]|uniref:Uncharacterized protein n=1 Tax=Paractinoplanes lichenicola TaxID=2802976 RepID=A0ABS1W3Q1_9ACTN|nr:hypothetical protein [Actinoplanes lichenicola]MBL7261364.1 hypothetical protein [Actinoplanes lichenicola]
MINELSNFQTAIGPEGAKPLPSAGKRGPRHVEKGSLYLGCSQHALEDISRAAQITVWDLVLGRNELWQFLAGAAAEVSAPRWLAAPKFRALKAKAVFIHIYGRSNGAFGRY